MNREDIHKSTRPSPVVHEAPAPVSVLPPPRLSSDFEPLRSILDRIIAEAEGRIRHPNHPIEEMFANAKGPYLRRHRQTDPTGTLDRAMENAKKRRMQPKPATLLEGKRLPETIISEERAIELFGHELHYVVVGKAASR